MIGEYSILPAQTHNSLDSNLTAGIDGNIWFTDASNNQLGRITPLGAVTLFALPGVIPTNPGFGALSGGITTGPDGNVWYTRFNGKIGRITPAGAISEFPVSLDSPRRITTGPDGNLWFTGGNTIGRITPAGVETEFPLPTPNAGPVGITAGPDGNLWFVEIGANKIGRITPAGVISEFPVLTPVPAGTFQLWSISPGPDGNLWFTETFKIGRITPAGVVTEFPNPSVGSASFGITAGPDGNLWFTAGNSNIGRITPAGVFLPEFSTPSSVSVPVLITTSPDGLIWFTESNTNKIGVISLENVPPYLPLVSGDAWTYQRNGSDEVTVAVAPGVFNVNGADTKLLQSTDGSQLYLTNDTNGIAEHRDFVPAPQATTITFAPPLRRTNVPAALGVSVVSSGVATSNTFGSRGYTGISTIEGFEVVSTPGGIFPTLRVQTSLTLAGVTASQINWLAKNVGVVKQVTTASGTPSVTDLLTKTNFAASLLSAVLPSSRSVQAGMPATAFATITNISGVTATDCSIGPGSSLFGSFTYQITDPGTNLPIGTPNSPASIPAGGSQSFVLAFTPGGAMNPTYLHMAFACANAAEATTFIGLNTLLLSASVDPVPDVVALAATPNNDGIVNVPGATGTGVFAVATVNVGAGGSITASADTGSVALPLTISLCQTNPTTGQCISAIGPTVTTQINAGETPTFGFFVTGTGAVPFDPANNRVFARFKDAGGITRGATSVAVRTQ